MVKEDSKYQIAIFNTYKTTRKNIFIDAGPGSGKSYTILKLIKMTPFYVRKLAVAFNKSIAENLKTKVPTGTDVGTIHSICYGILRRAIFRRYKLNEIKTWVLAKKVIKNRFEDDKKSKKRYSLYLHRIAELYTLYRMNLAEYNHASLTILCVNYNLDYDDIFLHDTLMVIEHIREYNSREHGKSYFMIDFTDMLWLPYIMVAPGVYPKYDALFIDEVQDLNPLQREMLLRLISKKGRFVAVGDERQAIYSFMGSNLESFNKFKSMPNTESMPLSISYRCARKIIDAANTIFPGLEARPDAPEGIIANGNIHDITIGDMVICRNNMPLVEMFLNLSGRGIKSHIMGRDLEKDLVNIIDRATDYEDFDRILNEKIAELAEHGVQSPVNHKAYAALKEKIDIIRLLMRKYSYGLEETKNLLKTLFSDNKKGDSVTLITSHKSKGLECKRVFWLFPELIPSQYAETEQEFYQETCLSYVIITRAMEELYFIPVQPLI